MRALQKDPAHRFADAEEFIVALEQARARIAGGRCRRGRTRLAPHPVPRRGLPERGRAELEGPTAATCAGCGRGRCVLLGAGRDRRSAAYAAARAQEGRGARRGRAGRWPTARRSLQNAGVRGRTSRRALRRRARGPRDRARARSRGEGREGLDGHDHVSDGPGDATIPSSRPAARRGGEEARRPPASRSTSASEYQRRRRQGQPGDRDLAGRRARSSSAGRPVTLVGLDGPRQVAVPDVVGQTSDDGAQRRSRTAGFDGRRAPSRRTPTSDPGTVLARDAGGGHEVAQGRDGHARRRQGAAAGGGAGRGRRAAGNDASDALERRGLQGPPA